METVLNWMAKGKTMQEVLEDWPNLTPEAITEALLLAQKALLERHKPKKKVG